MSRPKFYTFQVNYAPGLCGVIPLAGVLHYFDNQGNEMSLVSAIAIYLIAITYDKSWVLFLQTRKKFCVAFAVLSSLAFIMPVLVVAIGFDIFFGKIASLSLNLFLAIVVAKNYDVENLEKLGWEKIEN